MSGREVNPSFSSDSSMPVNTATTWHETFILFYFVFSFVRAAAFLDGKPHTFNTSTTRRETWQL